MSSSSLYSLLLAVSALCVVAASRCDPEWKYNPGTNACYKVIRDNLPWTVAEFKCLFQGSHHVAIQSVEENQFVREIAQHGEIWLGGAFFGRNMQYVNSDQSPFSFEHWKGGSRPALNRARRCIKMDSQGNWFQSCCKKKTFAVCKKAASAYSSWDDSSANSNQVSNDFRRAKFVRRH